VTEGGGSVPVEVERLGRFVAGVFRAIGCPADEADIVAADLVAADRMGLHSHGSARVGEYVNAARSGEVVAGGACTVVSEVGGSVLIDGGANYGQVVARFAFEIGAERARGSGVSCVVTRNSHHLGRVGALVERAAQANLIGIATVAVGLPGLVAPWGGAEGLLGTNPFAYGVPLEEGSVVADFATSTMAEGAARLALRDGRLLPEGMFIGPDGQPSTDPHDLFGDPPGALLPFGGPVGYKGYALNILPELVAATLAGYGPQDPARPSNCLFLVLVDPSAFLPAGQFRSLATGAANLITSVRPLPGAEVLLPGEREHRHFLANRDRVGLPRSTCDELTAIGDEFGIRPDWLT
jgi:hydroxycarboxylate dehydrogenase B